jgi:hypothetical protein
MNKSTSRKSRRAPRSAEIRASNWVASHEKRVLHGSEEQTPAVAGALTVRRSVIHSTEDGLLTRHGILDLLAADHGADVFPEYGTSLLSPKEGKRLIGPDRGDFFQIKHDLEAVTETFPSQLEGFIGKAVTLGVAPKAPGPRFVGYSFDVKLRKILREERGQLGIKVNDEHLRATIQPHITLFRTTDQRLAEELEGQLNDLRTPLIPVELGRAEVIPIRHMRHFA